MNTDLKLNDELLMAYADGELEATQAAQVEQAMQQDAGIAARVAQHRALRTQLQNSFAAVLSEPVPQQLLSSLQAATPDNSKADSKVVDLAQARERKQPLARHRWNTREWGAMAASLIAGVVLGLYALNFNSGSLITAGNNGLLAQGKLASALTTQLASTAAADQAIQIGISFRNQAGEYCRSFAVQDGKPLAGLACRTQGNWRVQMLTESAADTTSEFRQAGSTIPAAILTLIDQQIAGEPLDADTEAAAQRAGWN